MTLLFLFITFTLQTLSIPGYYNMPVSCRMPVPRYVKADSYPPWGKTHRRWNTRRPHKAPIFRRGHL